MRKFLVSAAIAVSALTAAAPAAAQYYPPQGYGYGNNFNYGHVRSLDARIDALQRQIRHLDRRNILSDREANRLRDQSNDLERRLRRVARNGFNQWEARDIETRIYRLEARLHRDARDGNHWRRY